MAPDVDVNVGYVTARVHQPGKMYVGLEHSTTMRKNGYVLVGLKDAIIDALNSGNSNPTLTDFAIPEDDIRDAARNELKPYDGSMPGLAAPF